jgi:hypothetical protein
LQGSSQPSHTTVRTIVRSKAFRSSSLGGRQSAAVAPATCRGAKSFTGIRRHSVTAAGAGITRSSGMLFVDESSFHPNQHRSHDNPNAHRDRVYEKIAEARMSSMDRQLSEFDARAKYHGPNAQQPFIPAVSDAESNSVQKKYAGMFELMGHKCDRPDAGGNQRQHSNNRQHEPRHCVVDISRQRTIQISAVLCRLRLQINLLGPLGIAQQEARTATAPPQEPELISRWLRTTSSGYERSKRIDAPKSHVAIRLGPAHSEWCLALSASLNPGAQAAEAEARNGCDSDRRSGVKPKSIATVPSFAHVESVGGKAWRVSSQSWPRTAGRGCVF